MKRGTRGLAKIDVLMTALGIERWGAVGILESLWHWTCENTPRGDIGRFSDLVIARGIGWSGDPSALVAGLVEAGWIDFDERHRLLVHDWSMHAEDHLHAALARARAFFADGSAPKLAKLGHYEREKAEKFYSEINPKPGAGSSRSRRRPIAGLRGAGRPPSLAEPSLAKPSLSVPSEPRERARATAPSENAENRPPETRANGARSAPAPRRRAQKFPAVPFPADFDLTPELSALAVEHGVAEPERVWQRFAAHHRARGSTFASWPQAWLTWVLRENDRPQMPSLQFGGPRPNVHAAQETENNIAIAAARALKAAQEGSR